MMRVVTGYFIDRKTGKKYPERKIIGYARTRIEAKKILADYIDRGVFNPTTTFREVYDLWSQSKFKHLSEHTIKTYQSTYRACAYLHDKVFADIKLVDLECLLQNSGTAIAMIDKQKILLNQLFDFAIENDICSKNYAKRLNTKKYKDKIPVIYTPKEKIKDEHIKIIWEKSTNIYYQMILIMIYTGLRVSELLDLEKKDVYLEERYFDITKSKTSSGIRRVPICKKIYPFVIEWFNRFKTSKYLFCTPLGKHFKYRNYYDSYFKPLMKDLDYHYTPHHCRHTFISLMERNEIKAVVIQKIVGHESAMSLTERVYTHIEMIEMLEVVDKL